MGGHDMGAGFLFGGAFMLLWWLLIIIGIAALVGWIAKSMGSGRKNSDEALDILKERYARGEIDEKEFQKRKNDLTT